MCKYTTKIWNNQKKKLFLHREKENLLFDGLYIQRRNKTGIEGEAKDEEIFGLPDYEPAGCKTKVVYPTVGTTIST